MKKISLVSILFCISISVSACVIWQSKDESSSNQGRKIRILKMVLEGQNRIDFFGKILDQHGSAIKGANITIGMSKSTPIPPFFHTIFTYNLKSNSFGEFSLKNERGLSLSVEKISKDGYEYDLHRAVDENSISADYEAAQHPKASNPATPALFYMRKKGEATFVIDNGFGYRFIQNKSIDLIGFDVISGVPIKEKDIEKPSLNGYPLFCDFKVKVTLDPKAKTWTVVLSPGNATGGILASDQLLYEAPAEGYLPNYTFSVDYTKIIYTKTSSATLFKDKYLYLRSREPALYTRLLLTEITQGYATESEITIGMKAAINPYGDRNLEPGTGLPIDVVLKLEDEIRTAFEQGHRPPKPDLPKLVREWEKNRPLTEKVKALFKR